MLWVILSGFTQGVKIGPLAVGLLIVSIGASLGGPTGYAINPARDLSPVSPTPFCQSRARVTAIGDMPGSRSLAR
ncbi:glycerol uptake facilitator protein [Cutibacterium acnes JCM 18918]|nr:glycerol uptake facilitator protein [Cutibacterium acnes JCM 18918]